MPPRHLRHLTGRTEQGVLVLTLTESHLQGDTLAHALKDELLAAVGQAEAPKVVLDFQRVASLSSEIFRPLVSFRRHLQDTGGQLVLCNLSSVVASTFRATRLISSRRTSTATFEVQPDLAAALASVTQATAEE
jgi:anti-anti-sigma factor